MSVAAAVADPGAPRDGSGRAADEVPISERGPASPRVVVGFGFWLYLLSDIVMFATVFAAHAVLSGSTDGGPTGRELFDRRNAFVETALLLGSSVTCGLMMLDAKAGRRRGVILWGAATFLLGLAFLGLELREFADLIGRGAGPSRSAFLSAFFTLVGLHGAHVALGLLWFGVMLLQVATLGFLPMVRRRLLCFSLFWHALDIVWIGVFTTVYLLGTR
ncbi:cytochrome o ubiquinol oxidase subunit III [uncultured Methylobacterium sp.]|uniref:cytochrome o ubiquinol oxidase subunit III n=1 Tax=uncultured Methylobacterium sp. TaxID=157278 RepID=UPI00261D381F|nr:cytochrome o ubiquinol oxidase subunit III [uncultured Methylobacterium sp.]